MMHRYDNILPPSGQAKKRFFCCQQIDLSGFVTHELSTLSVARTMLGRWKREVEGARMAALVRQLERISRQS